MSSRNEERMSRAPRLPALHKPRVPASSEPRPERARWRCGCELLHEPDQHECPWVTPELRTDAHRAPWRRTASEPRPDPDVRDGDWRCLCGDLNREHEACCFRCGGGNPAEPMPDEPFFTEQQERNLARCEAFDRASEPRPENPPVSPEPERNPHGTFVAGKYETLLHEKQRQAWDEGFAACRAAFDAVVAERDEAVKKLGIAIDVTHEFEDEKIALADRLAKWERGEWPSTEAQHGVLLDQIKELAAERDAALAALTAIVRHADMPAGESWEAAYVEVTSMARDAVSGSSEPR